MAHSAPLRRRWRMILWHAIIAPIWTRLKQCTYRVAAANEHAPCFFLLHAHRLRPATRGGKGALTVLLNMLRAGRAPMRASARPRYCISDACALQPYCACVLSAVISASLRKVITPI